MSDLKQKRTENRPDTADAAGFGFIARRFLKDTSGSVLIYVGLTSFVFLGFAGLAVDVGHWYASKRTMQSAADAAALGGVFAVKKGSDEATIAGMARNDAALNGYDATTGAVVTINHPPSSGPYAGDMGAIEAIIRQPVPGFFSKLILDGPTNITARAVARAENAPACVIALDPSAEAAFRIVGTSDVVLDCGVQVNSSNPKAALTKTGTSCLTAPSVSIAGAMSKNGGGCVSPSPSEGMPAIADPLADLAPPPYSGCDETDLVDVTEDTKLHPGVYCGGIQIHEDAVVEFDKGVYVLEGVGLHITGDTVVTGDEVTFYLDPDTVGISGKGKWAGTKSVHIAGTSDVTLSAPTSGDYEGVLFYQDRGSDPNLENVLNGTSGLSLTGTLYFPNNHLKYAGNTEFGGAEWTSIVARTIEFVGTSYRGGKPGGAFAAALATPTLVE